jgi:5'-3' exonuclease
VWFTVFREVAILMKKYDDHMCRILISSDKDFLQLDNIHQYDWWGNKIERKIKNHEDFEMNSKEFLLWKILRGDISDNIKNVFPKYGDVKSYKLVKNSSNKFIKSSSCDFIYYIS